MIAARLLPSGLVHLVDAADLADANTTSDRFAAGKAPACRRATATAAYGWTDNYPIHAKRCHTCMLWFPEHKQLLVIPEAAS